MSYLNGDGLAILWNKIKTYVDNKIVGDIPNGSLTEVKFANSVNNKLNPIYFSSWSDFLSKIYGGTNSVIDLYTPHIFVGESSWSTQVLGSGNNGRCWGICFCYSTTTVHAIFMYSSQMYRMVFTGGARTISMLQSSSWVSV